MDDPRSFLRHLFDAALTAADPDFVVSKHIPEPPKGRLIVLGAGKAAAKMARAVEQSYDGDLEGCVVTRYGHAVDCKHIEVLEAAHPVPDEAGVAATTRIMEIAETAGPDDLVLFLISGGGSALLTRPRDGIDLSDKQSINAQLLRSGAAIDEINVVRKHLSAVKGGRLAYAASKARQITLMISDVPGDDPGIIASGPTVSDASPAQDALAIIDRYGIVLKPEHRALLNKDDFVITVPQNATHKLIASPQMALEAAAEFARSSGIEPMILSDRIEGEARDVAKVLAAIAMQVQDRGQPIKPPCVLLSGGETTVTVRGKGNGGRNVEFQLALALALEGRDRIYSIACDTDGVDGAIENAGGMVTPDTLERAQALGIEAAAALDDNDGHGFFDALDDMIITGPTMTNVNDFRAILIL